MRWDSTGRNDRAEQVAASDRGSGTKFSRGIRNVRVEGAHSIIRRPHEDLRAVDLVRVGCGVVRLELGDVGIEGRVNLRSLVCSDIHAVLNVPVRPYVASLVRAAEASTEAGLVYGGGYLDIECVHGNSFGSNAAPGGWIQPGGS